MSDQKIILEKCVASEIFTCPVCKNEFPDFDENGKHNFCSHIIARNTIINICMKCKIDFIARQWGWSLV